MDESVFNQQCFERALFEIQSLERLPEAELGKYADGLGTLRNFQECVRSICKAGAIDLSKSKHLRLDLNTKYSTNGDVLAALKTIRAEWVRVDPSLQLTDVENRAEVQRANVTVLLPMLAKELSKSYFLWPKRTFWGSAIGAALGVLLAVGVIGWQAAVQAIETRVGDGVVDRIITADRALSANNPLGKLNTLDTRTRNLRSDLQVLAGSVEGGMRVLNDYAGSMSRAVSKEDRVAAFQNVERALDGSDAHWQAVARELMNKQDMAPVQTSDP